MSIRISVLALAAALGACANLQGGSSPGGQPVYTATPATPAPATACSPVTPINVIRVELTGPNPHLRISEGRARIPVGDAMVRWRLPNSLEFLADGITFKPGSPAGPTTAPPTGNPQRFEWCFLSTAGKTWEYNLRVKTTGTSPTYWECDPTIINSEAILPLAAVDVPCMPLKP